MSFDDDEAVDDNDLRFVPTHDSAVAAATRDDEESSLIEVLSSPRYGSTDAGEEEEEEDPTAVEVRPNYLRSIYHRRVNMHMVCRRLVRTSFSLRHAPPEMSDLSRPAGSVCTGKRLGKGSSDVNGEVMRVEVTGCDSELALKVMPLRASHRLYASKRLSREALHLDTWIEVACIHMARDMLRAGVCPHFPIVARVHALSSYMFTNARILRRPVSAYHGRRWADDLSLGSADMDRIADEVARAIYDDRRAEEGTVSEAPDSDPMAMSPERLFRKSLRVADALNEPLLEGHAQIPALLLWMELWGGDMEMFLRDARPVRAVTSVIFQVCTAVHAFQHYYGVTMYDQHLGNVLVSRVDGGGYWTHTIGDATYHAPNVGYIAAIWDYSYAGTSDGRMGRTGSVRKNQLRRQEKMGSERYMDMYRVLNVTYRRLQAWSSLKGWSSDFEFQQLLSMIQKTRNTPEKCAPDALMRTWFGKGAPYAMTKVPEGQACLGTFDQTRKMSRSMSSTTMMFLRKEMEM